MHQCRHNSPLDLVFTRRNLVMYTVNSGSAILAEAGTLGQHLLACIHICDVWLLIIINSSIAQETSIHLFYSSYCY